MTSSHQILHWRSTARGRLAALRDLFTAHTTGDVHTTAAVQALNRALTCAPWALLLQFDPEAGFTRSANHPVTRVVEHVMAVIADDAA
ncbi:hypothetical protein SRABI83_02291 [Arthrobacter sp. Bi83]|uniref:ABATE domain-containing protein n=1 Tax=Arthrobacter sp. Bi83 TaxID=2822353 RepID=UPI001D813D60|nr:ABATE domain-containing protein [Arthrobacter sp. Bi83]CAH0217293.1 hypothetical protein SRABI83_02291 [Arthrobacter sp. Bi83]